MKLPITNKLINAMKVQRDARAALQALDWQEVGNTFESLGFAVTSELKNSFKSSELSTFQQICKLRESLINLKISSKSALASEMRRELVLVTAAATLLIDTRIYEKDYTEQFTS